MALDVTLPPGQLRALTTTADGVTDASPPTEAIPTIPGMPARTPSALQEGGTRDDEEREDRAADPADRDLVDRVLDDRVLDDRDEDDDLDDEFDLADLGDVEGVLWRAEAPPPLAPPPVPAAAAVPAPRAPEPPVPAAKRVRVVLAERKAAARPVRTMIDLQEDGAVGELLRTDLIASQLRVALKFAGLAVLMLGALPLLFAFFPDAGTFSLLWLRLPWLLLGVLAYPFLFGLGWWFTRSAERVEQNFADHVQDSGRANARTGPPTPTGPLW